MVQSKSSYLTYVFAVEIKREENPFQTYLILALSPSSLSLALSCITELPAGRFSLTEAE